MGKLMVLDGSIAFIAGALAISILTTYRRFRRYVRWPAWAYVIASTAIKANLWMGGLLLLLYVIAPVSPGPAFRDSLVAALPPVLLACSILNLVYTLCYAIFLSNRVYSWLTGDIVIFPLAGLRTLRQIVPPLLAYGVLPWLLESFVDELAHSARQTGSMLAQPLTYASITTSLAVIVFIVGMMLRWLAWLRQEMV